MTSLPEPTFGPFKEDAFPSPVHSERPAAILGMPVGFVGAMESKRALEALARTRSSSRTVVTLPPSKNRRSCTVV